MTNDSLVSKVANAATTATAQHGVADCCANTAVISSYILAAPHAQRNNFMDKLKYPGVFRTIDQKHGRTNQVYIKRVLYNDPATVVFWSDGTKTTSRCSDEDVYNPETGFALCLLKKFVGGTKLHDAMSAWMPDDNSREHFDIDIKGVRARLKQK